MNTNSKLKRFTEVQQNLKKVEMIVESLKHYFLNGGGMGIIPGIVEMIVHDENKELSENRYFKAIQENSNRSIALFNSLEESLNYTKKRYSDGISKTKVFDSLQSAVDRCTKKYGFTDQPIHIETMNHNNNLYWSGGYDVLLEELITNSMKYSPKRSSIFITFMNAGFHEEIMIFNEIQANEGGISGIPKEFEQTIFEPFIRLNNFVNEEFQMQELITAGLGLTICEYLILKMDGYITIAEGVNHATGNINKKCIITRIGIRKE